MESVLVRESDLFFTAESSGHCNGQCVHVQRVSSSDRIEMCVCVGGGEGCCCC